MILLFSGETALAQITLSGKIKDIKSEGLPNVSVHVLNTYTGTVSNEEGEFILEKILPGNYTIHFSSVGYVSKTEDITVGKNNQDINITLEEQGNKLDEVVVTAQKKRNYCSGSRSVSRRFLLKV